MKTMSELERIDAEIVTAREGIERLVADKERNQSIQSNLATERSRIAFSALAKKNESDRSRLTQLQVQSRAIGDELCDLESAISEAKSKLESLQQQRAAAYRRQRLDELRTKERELIDVIAPKAEAALAGLIDAKNEISSCVRDMQSLARDVGDDKPFKNLLRIFWRGVEQRLAIAPIWLNREAKQIFSQPIDKIFEQALREQMPDDESQELHRKAV